MVLPDSFLPSDFLAYLRDETIPFDERWLAIARAGRSQTLEPSRRLALLTALLAIQEEKLKTAVIDYLGNSGVPEILAVLRNLLSDSSYSVRNTALGVLALHRDPSVLPACAQLVCHGTERERSDALGILIRLGKEMATSLLENYWQATDFRLHDRLLIATSLARWENPLCETYLEEQLFCEHPFNWHVRIATTLGHLRNRNGLLEVKRLAEQTTDPTELNALRFIFSIDLGIHPETPNSERRKAAVAWVLERLTV
jgi:hypothetical protein